MAVTIRITGIDTDNVGKPRNDGSAGSALYRVPFKLSEPAPSEWCQLFEHHWKNRFASHKRPLETSSTRVTITQTTLDEVETYHKADLKEICERVNTEYNAYIAKRNEQELKKMKEDRESTAAIEAEAKRLNEGWDK